jgi:YidC/Oxa1 family membrane protein insertase
MTHTLPHCLLSGLRSLLIPLSVQQNKGMEYQKALKPYINEIKEKFKDNKDAQNRAIGKLFEDAQQNPLSGCFLSLAQLPVLLGLYRGIRNLAQDGVLKEPFLWIPSLEGPVSPPDFKGMDWLTQGWETIDGIPTPQLGWETTLAFLIMPVILVLGQSLTMRVMTPAVDTETMSEQEAQTADQTQGILKFLPLLIGYFSLQVPAGLTIYWFTTNLFTLTQSLAIKAYYRANPPEINLPDFWKSLDKDVDSMSPDEKRAAAEAGLSIAPAFASLLEGTLLLTSVSADILLYRSLT